MVQINFNAQQYAPNTGAASVLPSGDYDVQITRSELKPTKRQDGQMLVFTLSVIAGPQAGKSITARLNIQNPSQQAMEIAYGELSAISHVTGVLAWNDTQQLHGRPFKIRVEEVPRQDDPSKTGNEIRAYMDSNGNPPSPNGGATAPAAPPAAPPIAPPQVTAPAPTVAPPAAAPWQAPVAAPQQAPAAAPWQAAPTQVAPQPVAGAAPPWAQG